jgi:tetratricopeptide (TPR) repeat protein
MRLALVVAPYDPRLGDAASRRDTLAWLRASLARFGFHVVIVGGGTDPDGDLARAVDKVSAGDTVLVHASGRLASRDSLACGESLTIPLGALSAALAARAPAQVSFVVELAHEEDASDPLLATEILGQAVHSLGAKERGFPVLAAVRPIGAGGDRAALTRLALPRASEHAGPPPTETLVASMYERALATQESHQAAQSFTFVRGAVPEPPPDEGPSSEYQSMPPPPLAAPGEDGEAHATEHSIHFQIAEATDARDWTRALLLRRDRLGTLGSPAQKARELVAIARILQVELGDADGAIQALEMARAMAPKRATVLLALRRGYEKLGRWNSALEVLNALAPLAPTVAERVTLRVAQARILVERVGDRSRAVEWLQAAVAEDPTHEEALALLRQLLPADVVDVDALERRAEKMLEAGSEHDALGALEAMALRSPMRTSAYEKAFALHWKGGRTDAAFLAALALEELDAADVDQQMLVDQFRSVSPMRARGSLDDAGWASMRAPGADALLDRVFAALAPAAIAARVDELRERRALPTLDPAQRLEETSTVTIGRTFHWAARVLSVAVPHLYVTDASGKGISDVPAREPSVALGSGAVSGRSAKDLAFLAGRQLAYYRPEYQVLLYYRKVEEMTSLLLAAAQIAIPDSAVPPNDDPVAKALRTGLTRYFDQRAHRDARAALQQAMRELSLRGGAAALGAWMCSAELTAARAGLLLAGDLATAVSLVRTEPGELSIVPAEGRRGDLVAFCASRAHAAIRQQVTITAPESLRPRLASSSAHALP